MYDLIIIGAGPAGLSAASNSAYRGHKTLVLERHKFAGGRPLHFYADKIIKDHTGFPDGVLSRELCDRFEKQAIKAGAEILCNVEALKITKKDTSIEVFTTQGTFEASKVLICIGILSIPNKHPVLSGYKGTGVYDKFENLENFRSKKLIVLGGGDNAFDTANQLVKIASSITILFNHEFPKAKDDSVVEAKANGITIMNNYELTELGLDSTQSKIEKVKLNDMKTKQDKIVDCDCIFSAIGFSPATTFLKSNGIDINPDGTIIVGKNQETNIPGVFAAGDISGEFNLIATACSSGIKAAINAFASSIKKPYWI